jgi:glyoxylase-like metal-dependent hydrolase (beta-lactamase superfamily II)
MPLFASLPWINVWALADDGGWAIVDTGIRSTGMVTAWETAFATALRGAPVTRVFATHMHPDHCGMAGWITERFDVRLWMSRLEYLTCRLMAADTGRSAPREGIDFYRAAGWNAGALQNYKAKFGSFGELIYPLPSSFRRLTNNEDLKIGGHRWRIVMGNGHSPEHACLYCEELKLFISGDQVLPRISSNVSVFPTEPDADPLGDWLTSLSDIRARIPDDVLVLPAHNSPFLGLHRRLDALISGHQRGLERLEAALLAEPKRAVDVFGALFGRPIGPDLLGMATGESIAHLNHLVVTNRAFREVDATGAYRWRAATR